MVPGYAREDRFVFVVKGDFFPGFGDQWNIFSKGRDSFEKALTTTLAAKDDAQFEQLWKEKQTVAEEVSLTDKTLKEVNKIFAKESPNAAKDLAKVNK